MQGFARDFYGPLAKENDKKTTTQFVKIPLKIMPNFLWDASH